MLDVIEKQSVIIQQLEAIIQELKDEIARLKDQKPKPKITPSQLKKILRARRRVPLQKNVLGLRREARQPIWS